tara:strand:- start:1145 stop:2851 length:1707 start_codon:yes stop_codon:yes gene_type:complete
MGFFQGLATGLAEGSTTAINKDMTRRQKQIDATINRIADRRERQLEKADVHDESVKEYYEEIAQEFEGDNVAALAAYNAMGGTLNSVKLIMDDYRQTKLSDPNTMSLSERLGQDGITYDKAKFGNISFDDALESLYKDVPTTEASDVQYQDTGLLSRLGLGKKDAGKSIAAQVNALIPGREAGEDYNISGATFDRTGMIASEVAKRELERGSMGELKAKYFTDSTNQSLTLKQRQEARQYYDDIIASENIGKGLATNSSIASAYNIRMQTLQRYIDNNTNMTEDLVIDGVTYKADDGTKETQIQKMTDNVNEEFSGVLIDPLTKLPISAAAEQWLKLSGNDKYYKVAKTEDKTTFVPEKVTRATYMRENITTTIDAVLQRGIEKENTGPEDVKKQLASVIANATYGLTGEELQKETDIITDAFTSAFNNTTGGKKQSLEKTKQAFQAAKTGQERFDRIAQSIDTVEIDNARIAKLVQDIKSNESAGTTGSGLTAGLSRFIQPNVYAKELVQSVFEELGVDIKVTKRKSPEKYAELEKNMLVRINKAINEIETKEKADRENIEKVSILN